MNKAGVVAVAVAAMAVVGAIAGTGVLRAAPSQDPEYVARQKAAIETLKPADGWQALAGNIRWRRIKGDGSGRHPTVQDVVRIHYAGSLIDGTEFDSSFKRGEPLTAPLDALIDGWKVGLPMAGVGDTIELVIPADLGYGSDGAGEIPGGATLVFRIELLGIE